MAQIDLKYTKIKLKDGYAATGNINSPDGYPAGALTIEIDTLTGSAKLEVGDTFTISGESGSPIHTVSAVTPSSGTTTRVTFTTVIASGGVADNAALAIHRTGAVNLLAGYTAATTILVDTITGKIPVGATFLIAGESTSPVHTVTSTIETAGNTTSLTFTTAATATNNDVITFSWAAAVNHAPGVDGVNVATINNFTGVVETGTEFTLAGESGSPVHTVLSHTETGQNTTSITFTPSATAVANSALITFHPHSLEVTIGEGTLEYTEKRNMEYKLEKGIIKYVRLGDQVPVDVSMDFVWEFLTAAVGGTVPTIEDVLKHRGLASTWVSTDTDLCQPYSVDIEVTYTPPCGGVEEEIISLKMYRWEELQHSFKDAQVSTKGKCNILEATVERISQS